VRAAGGGGQTREGTEPASAATAPPDLHGRLLWQGPTGAQSVQRTLGNGERILSEHPAWRGVLAYDEHAARVVAMRALPAHEPGSPVGPSGPLEEEYPTLYTQLWFERSEFTLRLPLATVYGAMVLAARKRPFHPIRDYLDGLEWDGTPRLDTWLTKYLGAQDSPYVRHVSAWWPISAIARVYVPGCQVDTMLVLEGPQGARKSTALRVLGGEWFTDTTIDFSEKDRFLAVRGVWILEHQELASVLRSKPEQVKAFLSSRFDDFRAPYGHGMQRQARQCVQCATTNGSTYLADDTGNRRFWPVRCGRILIDELAAVRDQLWAEARTRHQRGEVWYARTLEERALFETEQEERQVTDPWQEPVQFYLAARSEEEGGPHAPTTVAQVLEHALNKESKHWGPSDQTRVVAILKALGWEKCRLPAPHKGANRPWGYRFVGVPHPEGSAPR
jgi:putative DNA primase/helicase